MPAPRYNLIAGIDNPPDQLPAVRVWVEKDEHSGALHLCCADRFGNKWKIANITTRGNLERCNGFGEQRDCPLQWV